MNLETTTVSGWPPLAWLARCERPGRLIHCFTGPGVETAEEWLCEGVWAGPYDSGGLDRTDLVFGSGLRIRGDAAAFVSTGSTLDRLHSFVSPDAILVSNSLPCLLAFTGDSLDPGFDEYAALLSSIRGGLAGYAAELPTMVGVVGLTYFDNLVWDGRELRSTTKPTPSRDFSSYSAYRRFLDESMASIVSNAAAPQRKHPYGLMSTLSSGYDSAAVTALAQQSGCGEAFGFDVARDGGDDSGERIAEHLGIAFHPVPTHAWRSIGGAPLLFLGAGISGGADVSFKAAEAHTAGRVVFTGFHGDKVWDKHTKDLGPDLVRADNSGADLSEYRLWAGFVNCAVPFWGARQIRDIVAISHSKELTHWDVSPGYSRPICRRIVEERGVPRELFGARKQATNIGVMRPWDFLTPELRADYFDWLRSRRWEWIRRRTLPPMPGADAAMVRVGGLLNAPYRRRATRRLATSRGSYEPRLLPHFNLLKPRRMHRYVVHWAVERIKDRYRDALPPGGA